MTYKIILATSFLFVSTNSPALVSDYDYRRILEQRCRIIINTPSNPLINAEINELKRDICEEIEYTETDEEYARLKELINDLERHSLELQRQQFIRHIVPQYRSKKNKKVDDSVASDTKVS